MSCRASTASSEAYEGNEYNIASNHPINPHLMEQMGKTPSERQAFLERFYHEAEKVLSQV